MTRHPLGAELWAYVPKNLLPHLQWLGRPDYSHVYFMDLPIRVFDMGVPGNLRRVVAGEPVGTLVGGDHVR